MDKCAFKILHLGTTAETHIFYLFKRPFKCFGGKWQSLLTSLSRSKTMFHKLYKNVYEMPHQDPQFEKSLSQGNKDHILINALHDQNPKAPFHCIALKMRFRLYFRRSMRHEISGEDSHQLRHKALVIMLHHILA